MSTKTKLFLLQSLSCCYFLIFLSFFIKRIIKKFAFL